MKEYVVEVDPSLDIKMSIELQRELIVSHREKRGIPVSKGCCLSGIKVSVQEDKTYLHWMEIL